MNNIILTGMPGAGKSTVGVVLAKKLGYRFLDSDLVIQENAESCFTSLLRSRAKQVFLRLKII